MDDKIIKHLDSIEFGMGQTYENLTVVPLLTPETSGPDYLTLGQAQDTGALKIHDGDRAECLPSELRVENKSNQPVLLLDSEEVARGDESYCINTSILLTEKSDTIVSALATDAFDECGRERGDECEFHDSNIMMSPTLRAEKMVMVSDSLFKHQQFHADDGPLYAVILRLATRFGMNPEESEEWNDSMMQIYESQSAQLDKYEQAFQPIPKQKGLLAIINNKVIGFDLFSSELAYKHYASRLIKSYALCALSYTKEEIYEVDGKGMAEEFLMEVRRLEQKKYKSLGCGSDIRFSNRIWDDEMSRDSGTVEGTALEVDGTIIHMSFLALRHLPDCTSCPPEIIWD